MMIQCPDCNRHLISAGPCPFCDATSVRRGRTGLLAASLAAVLTGCPADPEPTPDGERDAATDQAVADAQVDMFVALPPYGIPPPVDMGQPIDMSQPVDMAVDMPIAVPPYGIPPEPDAPPPDMGQPVDMALQPDAIPQPPYGIPPEPDPTPPDMGNEPDMETPVPPYGIPPDGD